MVKKADTHAAPWKRMAQRWQKYYRPPGRPSKTAVRLYRKYSRLVFRQVKGRRPRALILGSTPELRDLMFELGAEVTTVDLNREMIGGLRVLMRHKGKAKEKHIIGNWSSVKLPKNYFDAIVGDIVLANVEYRNQDRFLGNMLGALAPNGRFIQKMQLVPEEWEFESAEGTLQKFSRLRPYRNEAFEMILMLLQNTFERKQRLVSFKKVRKRLAPHFHGGKWSHPDRKVRKMLHDMWEFWKPMSKEWSIGYEGEVEKRVGKFFIIEKKIVLKDCHFRLNDESYPLWVCKPKMAKRAV